MMVEVGTWLSLHDLCRWRGAGGTRWRTVCAVQMKKRGVMPLVSTPASCTELHLDFDIAFCPAAAGQNLRLDKR